MSLFRNNIIDTNNATGDAFGRLRVGNPETIFDSKQLNDNQALFWDDQQVSGSGTSSTHSSLRASSILQVGASTTGRRVRQTYQRFNYQSGKSQLILLTGVLRSLGGGSGVVSRIGLFDDDNGLFFECNEGTINVVMRSNATGSVVNTTFAKTSWNLDRMDGTGGALNPSGLTFDETKTNIFVIDFEWLGVGRVRMGLNIDGVTYYVHEFKNANNLSVVYMSNPNLPLRYELLNDGTGVLSELECICSSVVSEGGAPDTGIIRYSSTDGTTLGASTAGIVYALMGIRLKSSYLNSVVRLLQVAALARTNDDFEWTMRLNPTVAGTFSYSGESNSPVETAFGVTANTVTGGTFVMGGFANRSTALTGLLSSVRYLGSAIDGTPDEFIFCVRPVTNGLQVEGGIVRREIV